MRYIKKMIYNRRMVLTAIKLQKLRTKPKLGIIL